MDRILLLLSEERSDLIPQLKEWLRRDHVAVVGDPEAGLRNDFDLCILDGPTAGRLAEEIKARKKAESPVPLPFLLIVSRQDVERLDRHLLQAVDELICTPIEEVELRIRVQGLMRIRRAAAEAGAGRLEVARQLPHGMLLLQQKIIAYANPAFCEVTGKSLAELKGMDFLRFVHPDDRAPATLFYDNVMAGNSAHPALALRLLTPKDSLWVELRLNTMVHDGAPTMLATVVEIVAGVAAEKSLEAALEYTENIVQTVREPMLVLDSDLRILSVNLSFCRTFRIGSQEARGRLFYELGNRQWDIPPLRVLLSEVLIEQTTMEGFEVEHHFPSVGRRTMLLNARKIRSRNGDEPHLILLAMEDVTERKELENALRRINQQLEEKLVELENANEELSQFAYVTSHDLKAPLRAIHNYADFLREDLEDTLGGEQLEFLDGLTLAVRQGEALIDDLLAFSRIGRIRQAIDKIDLGAVVREMQTTLESAEEVELTIADAWPVIEVEKTLLTQVIWNLASNAVKFNRSDTKHVELGWRPCEDGFIELYVRDDGIGIDPAYHRQIFRIFQRLHTREEFEGTGIGLAIVRKAVQLMGGSIRVESGMGDGSTFFVTLPGTRPGVQK